MHLVIFFYKRAHQNLTRDLIYLKQHIFLPKLSDNSYTFKSSETHLLKFMCLPSLSKTHLDGNMTRPGAGLVIKRITLREDS